MKNRTYNTMKYFISILIFFICLPLIGQEVKTLESKLAFPGAIGFGKNTIGGRGGDVYHVTTLAGSGEGSIKEAISTAVGPRTIVFDVSGDIIIPDDQSRLSEQLIISANRGGNNISILGQTAPTGGVTFRGASFWVQGVSEIILRHFRIRPGIGWQPFDSNGDEVNDDALVIKNFGDTMNNIVFDHLSLSWGEDGTFDIGGNSTSSLNNLSLTNTLIYENYSSHYNALLSPTGVDANSNMSFIGNCFVHGADRSPSFSLNGNGEYINNVAYYAGRLSWVRGQTDLDYIGNINIINPAYTKPNNGGTLRLDGPFPQYPGTPNVYMEDSYDSWEPGGIANFSSGLAPYEVSSRLMDSGYAPLPSNQTEQYVLQNVGAYLYRDSADARVLNDVINLTGGLINSESEVGGFPILPENVRPTNFYHPNAPNIAADFYNEHGLTGNGNGVTTNWSFEDYDVINNAGYTDEEMYWAWLANDFENLESANPPNTSCPGSTYEITASESDGSNVPCNLVDDNLGTRWGAFGDGNWVMFDLGSVQEVNQVQIAFYQGSSRVAYFGLQVSDDAVTWTDVYGSQQQSGGTSLELQDFDFPLRNARYVRYLGQGNSVNDWNSLTEMRVGRVSRPVTGVTVAPDILTLEPSETGNLTATVEPADATEQGVAWSSSDEGVAMVDSLGAVTAVSPGSATIAATTDEGGFIATAEVTVPGANCPGSTYEITASESDGSNVPCNLVDDNLGTRWGAFGDGNWVMFDLGSVQEVNQVQIAFYQGSSRVAYFGLQVSDDAVTWTDVYGSQQQSGGTSLELQDFDFPLRNARYVRYLGQGNSVNDWNSLTEMRVGRVSRPVTGVTVAPDILTLEPSETGNLTATVEPADATEQGVAWSSSDEGVAMVDSLGAVTAVSPGSATIAATTDEGGFIATAEVTVPGANCPGSTYEITASESDGSNVPCNLVDDNLGTRWGAFGDGNWVMFDLGSVQEVNQVQIAFYQGSSRVAYFGLQVSDDAVTWTDVYGSQQQSGGTSLELQDFDFPLRNARYVRYLGQGNSVNDWNSLTEMRVGRVSRPVTGVTVAPDILTLEPSETGNLTATVEPADATEQGVAWSSSDEGVAMVDSLGAVTAVSPGSATIAATTDEGGFIATAEVTVPGANCPGSTYEITASESDGSNVPCNLVDDNLGTRWGAFGDGNWVMFDLGSVQEVNQVQIAFYQGSSRVAYFGLQVSDDAVTWTDVYGSQQQSGGTSLELQDFDFPLRNARYVRYLGQGNSVNDWNSLTEMRVGRVSRPVTGVTVAPDILTLEPSETGNLTATVEPADATEQGVAWSSSDEGVAMVDSLGAVTAVSPGSATIAATTDEGGFIATAEVTVPGANCPGSTYEITASESDGSNVPCNLVDDNLGTRWGAFGDGNWVMFDLGSVQEVNQVQIAFYQGSSRVAYFGLQVSDDAVTWTDVYGSQQQSGGTSLELQDFDFPLRNARYVRYLGQGNSVNDWNSLTEMRVGRIINPQEVILDPIQDAYLQGSTSYNNGLLRVNEGNRVAYLKYDLSSINGEITNAELRFRMASDTGNGTAEVHIGSNTSWTETNLDNSNKPLEAALWGTTNDLGQTSSDVVVNLSTSISVGGGTLSLVVKHAGNNDFAFASKENATFLAPRLVLTYRPTASLKAQIVNTKPQTSDQSLAFPNPATNIVNILGITGRKNIVISDFSGRTLHREVSSSSEPSLDLSLYAPGTYYISVSGKTEKKVFKVIKW